MDGIGHNVFWIHRFLKKKHFIDKLNIKLTKKIKHLSKKIQKYFMRTFKLLLILCIVTLLPLESVTQPAAYT